MADTGMGAESDKSEGLGAGNRALYFMAGLVVLLAAGLYVIIQIADAEARRDLESWKSRLDLIVESRASDASKWFNQHLDTVEDMSRDPSLQLYTSEVSEGDPDIAGAQRSYVFNLLSAEADRSGFYEERAVDQINANVRRPNRAGLAVFSSEGDFLVASRGMPQFDKSVWFGDHRSSFITLGPVLDDGKPLVIFGAPIPAGEGSIDMGARSGGASGIVGWVLGALPLGETFHTTLDQPGITFNTFETYALRLVDRVEGDTQTVQAMIPLTPLRGGGRLLQPRIDEAASFAANNPGTLSVKTNYAGEKVLATGRDVAAPIDWQIVASITAAEALTSVEQRRTTLVLVLTGVAVFLLVVIYLVWRLGVSERLASALSTQASLSARNESLARFVSMVSDTQPAALAAVDASMKAVFVNARMAHVTGLPLDELRGRRLDVAFTKDVAADLKKGVNKASAGDAHVARVTLPADEAHPVPRIMQVVFAPLEQMEAFAGTSLDGIDHHAHSGEASALLVMEDITDLVSAQERSDQLLDQLVGTLTQIIDSRDPWSKHHSGRVSDVAVAIAEERGFDEIGLDTVRRASQMVNIGKIFVPRTILTKEGQLTADELAMVREGLQRGADLIEPLNFKGPVGASMAQINARWDGDGEPKGLAGDDIEPAARVLAVANAFVGMVSSRAHRGGFDFEKAIDILQGEAGSRYERASVAALQNVLENKGGRERWSAYGTVID